MYAWGLPSFKKIVTDYYVKTGVDNPLSC